MKNIIKKCLSIILTLTIIFTSALTGVNEIVFKNVFNNLIVGSQAVVGGACGDNLTWEIDNCTLTISGEGEMSDYTTDNMAPWYGQSNSITSVEIEDGVNCIGAYAFAECENLINITIPESVTRIGEKAFADCKKLEEILLPDNITNIGEFAFYNTSYYTNSSNWEHCALYIGKYFIEISYCSCKSIYVKDGTKVIAENAFNKCNTVSAVNLPDSVSYINSGAFEFCNNLTSIVIPSEVVIDTNAFNGCNALKNVYYRGTVSKWAELNFGTGNDVLQTAEVSHICTYVDWSKTTEPTCEDWGIASSICQKCRKRKTNEVVIDSALYPESKHNYADSTSEMYEFNYLGAKALRLYFSLSTFTDNGFDFIYIYDSKNELLGRYTGFELAGAMLYIPGDSFTIKLTSDTTYSYYGFSFDSIIADFCASEELKPIGHTYSSEWTTDVEPDCTNKGSKSHHCVNCDDKIDVTEISAKGHNYSEEWIIDVEPGCVTNGSASRHCSACGDKTDIKTVNPIGHKYQISGEQTEHPHARTEECVNCSDTLTKNGRVDDCFECNFTITESSSGGYKLVSYIGTSKYVVIPESYNGKIIDEIGMDCFNGNTSVVSVAIPETVVLIQRDAFSNCFNLKYVFYSGDRAAFSEVSIGTGNNSLESAVIHYDSTGHNFIDRIDIQSTCLSAGVKHQECNVCGFVGEYSNIPETGHTISDEWTIDTLPNCSEKGSKSHHCLNCEYKTDVTEIEPIGHNFGDWVLITAPACVNKGVAVRTCSTCQYEQNDEEYSGTKIDSGLYPESDHNYGDNISEIYEFSYNGAKVLKLTFSVSTYTEPDADFIYIYDRAGELLGKYSGDELSGKTIEIPGEAFTIKLTSDTSYGRYGFSFDSIVADFCNLDMVNPVGHDFSDEWIIDVAPTCTENGSKSHHCITCGAKSDVTTIESDGHNYVLSESVAEHPHTSKYICYVCNNEKVEDEYLNNCLDCNFTITANDSNSYKIVSYIGKQSKVIIPDTYNGKPITKIDNNCFKGSLTVMNVVLPNTITTIGNAAFYGCTNLASVTIPDGVTSIGNGSFFGCANLSFIVIPNGITSIGNAVFRNCEKLSSVTIKGRITSVGLNAFDGCNALKKVYYSGSEAEWSKTTVASGNMPLNNAEFLFEFSDHPYVDVIDIAPTCTETGVKHKVCAVCGIASGDEIIPALGHSFTDDWRIDIDPTCTEDGSKSNNCDFCGEEKTEVIPATGHNYSTEWITDIEPTCTENGSKSHHCYNCGDIKDVTVIESLGHSYSDWSVDTEATCIDSGSKHKTCSVCNDVVTEIISANGHSFSEDWTIDVDANCTEDGSKSRHCENCEDVTDITVIPSTGHSYDDWIITLEPTCTEDGSKYKTCSACNDVVSEIIQSNGHNYSSGWIIDIEPTCTDEGSKHITCSACNDVITEIIPANGHKFRGYWVVTERPTCTETGLKYEKCNVCGYIETLVMPANGHNYSSQWTIDVTPTCTEEGSKSHHCANCDAKTDITVVSPNGHGYGDWVIIEVPTCTEDGSKYRICSICDYVETVTMSAFGHSCSSDWIIDIEPTCTEEGSKSHHCIYCDEKIDSTVIEATGHNYSDWSYDELPSCTGYGSRSKSCWICSDVISEPVLPTGHSCSWEYRYEENIKIGTCYECGETVTEALSSMDVITFTLNSDETAYSVTDCSDYFNGEIIIPETYNDLPVTSIATDAFRDCTGITSVIIPDSVTSIGGSAFRDCTSLAEIRLSENIQTIPGAMLCGCDKLESIVIPADITTVGGYAFSNCTELKYVFYENDELSWNNIIFGTNNEPLTNAPVHFKSTKHSYIQCHIEPTCTQNGSDHKECTVCGHKTEIVVIDALGHSYGEWNIILQPTCTEYGQAERICSVCSHKQVVGGSVIVDSSLYPESNHPYQNNVSEWYDFSYEGAESLELTFSTSTLLESSWDKIHIYNADGSLYNTYTSSSLSGKTITLQGDSFRINLTTDGSVTKYGFSFDSIVANMVEDDVIIPLGHDYSDEWVIDVHPTCTEDGQKSHPCSLCGDKADITVINATGHQYSDWTVVSEVSCIKNGYKFKDCSACGDTVTETTQAWGHNYTAGWVMDVEPTKTTEGSKSRHCTVCDAKTDILPVEVIDNITFALNDEGNAYIVTYCEKDAEGEIVIPDTYSTFPVISIAADAFRDCTGITSVYIPDSITTVGGSAFRNCTNLTEVRLSGNIDKIPGAMLFGCKALESVMLPASIESIGGYAFGNCPNLKYIFYESDESSWENITINSNNTPLTDNPIHYNSSGNHIISTDWTIDLPATCTEDGVKSRYCVICDYKFMSTTIPATGHNYGDWNIIKIPTCTDDGVAEKVCSSCGFVSECNEPIITKLVDSSLYPESKHNYREDSQDWFFFDYDGAISLTFTFSKNTKVQYNYDYIYIYKSDGSLYGRFTGTSLAGRTITLSGDSFSIKLTSDSIGTAYGFSFDSIVAEMNMLALGHDYSVDWFIDTEATCTENGSKSRRCSICDEQIDITVIPALGHNYGDWNVDLEATCTTNGLRSRVCSACGDTVVESIIAMGHDYSSEWSVDVIPTCTEKGAESRHCSRCDSRTDINVIPANGHSSSDWIVDVQSTCTENGLRHKECTECLITLESEEVFATGHDVVIDSAVPNDCVQSGLTEGSHCSVCGVTLIEQVTVPATGHTMSGWIIDKDSTCTTDGLLHKECAICKEILTTGIIPAKGHTSSDWIVDNTEDCINNGSKHKECTICKEVLTTGIIPAKGHISSDWIVDNTEDCINNGSKHKECTVCSEIIASEIIPATGHVLTDWIVDADATCTVNGSKHKDCVICGATVNTVVIPATGHSYSEEWFVDIEPNCTQTGSKSHHCLNCGNKSDVTVVDALGHNYGDWQITLMPTCTEEGEAERYCGVCGFVQDSKGLVDSALYPESEHNYNNDVSELYEFKYNEARSLILTFSDSTSLEDGYDEIRIYYGDGELYGVYTGQELAGKIIVIPGDYFCIQLVTDYSVTNYGFSFESIVADFGELDIINAIGHDYSDEWIIDVAPTCSDAGSKSHHCLNCGDKINVTEIEANGHSYVLTDTSSEHPHTEHYCCLSCNDIKNEASFVDDCIECNYTMTTIGSVSYKLLSYKGSQTDVVVPSTFNGMPISAIGNACYKDAKTIVSVVVPDTVTSIGGLAFMNCSALKEIYIPSSVTNIGVNAFYNHSEDLIILCEKDSVAHKYAVDNGIKYMLVCIFGAGSTTIDYNNFIIRTTVQNSEDISEILNISQNSVVVATASYIHGELELYGTGTIVTVFAGDEYVGDYILIVEGDTNGDSVCDVLDCFDIERVSNGNFELSDYYAQAGDINCDGVIDIADYQGVVNKSVA